MNSLSGLGRMAATNPGFGMAAAGVISGLPSFATPAGNPAFPQTSLTPATPSGVNLTLPFPAPPAPFNSPSQSLFPPIVPAAVVTPPQDILVDTSIEGPLPPPKTQQNQRRLSTTIDGATLFQSKPPSRRSSMLAAAIHVTTPVDGVLTSL